MEPYMLSSPELSVKQVILPGIYTALPVWHAYAYINQRDLLLLLS